VIARSVHRAPLYLLLGAIAALKCFPLLWMISTSLKTPGLEFVYPPEWIPNPVEWGNYVRVWTEFPMAIYARNSFGVTVLATLGTVLSASVVAFGFAWMRFVGRDFWFTVLLSTMMLPEIVTLIPRFILFGTLGWIDTLYPLIVPYWFGGAFSVFLIRQFFLTLPYELVEAAIVDGASYLRIYWQIMLPLAGPSVAAVSIFSFVAHWNDFLHPLIYTNSPELRTLALGLRFFLGEHTSQWSMLMAASVVMLLPVLMLFFSAQRYFIQGIHLSGLTGR
jgi:multiple sugar transport system permease protein